MPEKNEDLVRKELEINALNGCEAIRVYFLQTIDDDSLSICLLSGTLTCYAFVAVGIHPTCFKGHGVLYKLLVRARGLHSVCHLGGS
jgi:hypothetical protein